MSEPSLIEVFGVNATQTATTITIAKADLPMTPLAVNGGERILAAIIKHASIALDPTRIAVNNDQSISIEKGFDSLTYRTIGTVNTTYLRQQLLVNFDKENTSVGINPDDY